MKRDALSFTFNGTHEKAERSVDPLRHLQMLLAAIDWATSTGEYSVIVAANNLSVWDMPQAERTLMWEVYKRADIVTCREKHDGHYLGACWAARMATEAAAGLGAERLLFLAEDILLNKPATEILDEMGDADYIGSSWGDDHSLSVQMFGCRVASFADLQSGSFLFSPPFDKPGEWYLWLRANERGLKWIRTTIEDRPLHYFHNHDPDTFLQEAASRGVRIAGNETNENLEADAGMYIYDRIGYGHRELELCPNGTIGIGAGAGEATWSLRTRGDERRLSIFDNTKELLCELIQLPSGVWRGRWNRYERMEIVLSRIKP